MSDLDTSMFWYEDGAPARSRARSHVEGSVMPVEWPDFTRPPSSPLRHPVAIAIESLTLRPLDPHLALATLRLRIPAGIDAALRVSVEPLDPTSAQVRVLRTHLHHEQCPPSGCAVALLMPARSSGGIMLELRLEGERVGMVPPALYVRASVMHRTAEGIDEAMTARQITPRLTLPDDMSALD